MYKPSFGSLLSLSLAVTSLSGFGSICIQAHPLADNAPVSRSAEHSKVATGYYAGKHANVGFPLSKVSWDKYTHLIYSFEKSTLDVNTLDLGESNPALLPQFVSEAHKHGVKALVAIGGWTGSRGFSSDVGSAANRTAFVKTVTKLVKQYNLDGIEFDWEYPATKGFGCNLYNSNDAANFLAFLQELRRDPTGSKLILAAAGTKAPYADATGKPLTDVSAFSKVLDWVSIMNYDVWGAWSPTVGPNAPLADACAPAVDQAGSATSMVQTWRRAGMPAEQIVLAVPTYGHTFSVPKATAIGVNGKMTIHPAFNKSAVISGDRWDDRGAVGECTNPGGIVNFWGMMELGYLNADGKPKDHIDYRYDACSQTPYVYNRTSELMMSYDNADSFAAKGKFISSNGLRGFALWEAGGDSNDILLDAIHRGLKQ